MHRISFAGNRKQKHASESVWKVYGKNPVELDPGAVNIQFKPLRMIPNPRQRQHYQTERSVVSAHLPVLILIGILVVLHLWQTFSPDGSDIVWMLIPARVELSWKTLLAGGGGWEGWQGLLTVFTHSLLHGGFDHLINNLLFLWIFAGLIGRISGPGYVYLIFVFTAITGAMVHMAMNRGEPVPALGASGAVMGFEGVYLALAVRWRLPDPFIWPMSSPVPPAHLAALAVLGFSLDYHAIISGSTSNIAYGAHLGGFFGGLILGSFVLPRPKTQGR